MWLQAVMGPNGLPTDQTGGGSALQIAAAKIGLPISRVAVHNFEENIDSPPQAPAQWVWPCFPG
jgi:hypothetical protein